MGVLNVCCYPTALALYGADHTYVECESGSYAWGCWGGDSGGTVLRSSHGSTKRADLIAEPDGRANITHYLINGVCHQAANRILRPANITARDARGYLLSVSLFGVLGRPSAVLGRFKAPLYEHASAVGDLDVCLYQGMGVPPSQSLAEKKLIAATVELYKLYYPELVDASDTGGEQQETGQSWDISEAKRAATFQIKSFKLLVRYRYDITRRRVTLTQYHQMMKIREEFERSREVIEQEFVEGGRNGWLEFVRSFDALTQRFQEGLATILPEEDYKALLDISRDERIVLSDPAIVESIYEPESRPRGPGRRSP
ncbi:hypothetical protein VDG64_00655 [Xanthomonas campestris pv. raphani]|uniref:hypothetical protein n=1 Tax=Xanthomonas campestris TaxID=339 RepID=UPI002B225238|nr:hypothetical protein [Xanthomonas campestris]MEA9753726.1 hypothetical protein [Xanthomonas campestris pv. raphani]MEA9955335.1 hypothetical protein [Xanthomonas campestris pv. raphani]MEA9959395.1 hypothetical protein [Xanthomonas campestris pv. raphani]